MHHFALAGLLVLPNAAMPQPQSAPSHIQLEDVTRAVLTAHPELAGASVELPTAIPAREAAPALEAGPLEHWPAGSSQTAHVRLHCKSEMVCRPFYATVHLPEPARGEAAPKPAEAAARVADTLRPGAHASMLIDSGRIHLRIPVTCLGSGAPGAPIRVAGPKNAHIYQATIVDAATVRGVL